MKKYKKIILTIFFIALVGISIVILFPKDQFENISKEEITKEQEKFKFLKIKYLVMDKSDEEYDLNNVFPDYYDDFLYFTYEYALLNENKESYTFNLEKQVNEKILENINDVAFAYNNDEGMAIDDCKFDKEIINERK